MFFVYVFEEQDNALIPNTLNKDWWRARFFSFLFSLHFN